MAASIAFTQLGETLWQQNNSSKSTGAGADAGNFGELLNLLMGGKEALAMDQGHHSGKLVGELTQLSRQFQQIPAHLEQIAADLIATGVPKQDKTRLLDLLQELAALIGALDRALAFPAGKDQLEAMGMANHQGYQLGDLIDRLNSLLEELGSFLPETSGTAAREVGGQTGFERQLEQAETVNLAGPMPVPVALDNRAAGHRAEKNMAAFGNHHPPFFHGEAKATVNAEQISGWEQKLEAVLDKLRNLVQQMQTPSAHQANGNYSEHSLLAGQVPLERGHADQGNWAAREKNWPQLDKIGSQSDFVLANKIEEKQVANQFFFQQQGFGGEKEQQGAVEMRIPGGELTFSSQLQAAKDPDSLSRYSGNVSYPQISHQVIKHVKLLLSEGKSQITFQLEPKELGRLTLRVNMEQGMVLAKFTAASLQVKNLLEANLSQLRQSLEELGIKESRLEIGLSQQFLGEGSSNQAFAKPKFNYKANNQPLAKSGYEEVELSSTRPLLRPDSSFEFLV